jgi:hypothetical protein
MATIITKNSQTASAVPDAASLSVGELAVNTADGKLYTEHTGGVVKEIIPSTVADGGITEAKIASNAVTEGKIASNAVTTAKIADANVTGAKLENSGVTAGSYGSASVVPVVTVDAKGRLTSVSTAALSVSPTTAQVLSAYSGAAADAVGTYAFAKIISNGVNVAFGGTRAGSQLRPTGAYLHDDGSSRWEQQANYTMSGTWRCMGADATANLGVSWIGTLWLRIS